MLYDSSLILFLANHYENNSCLDVEEFYEDVYAIKYIKKHLYYYENKKELKKNLLINHFVKFYNNFEKYAVDVVLFSEIDNHIFLKTILIFLGRCPEIIKTLDGNIINVNNIEIDKKLLDELNK